MNKERALEILEGLDWDDCSLKTPEARERVAEAMAQDREITDTLALRARALADKIRDMIKLSSVKGESYRHPPSDATTELMALEQVLNDGDGKPRPAVSGDYTKVNRDVGYKQETVEFHESFGVAQFSRVSGACKLFDSSLDMHPQFIEMRVYRAERHRSAMDNANVWRASSGDHNHLNAHISSVRFSAAQFAELITCMNMGDGVACTIAEVAGVTMQPVPPEVMHEHEEIIGDIRKELAANEDTSHIDRADAILEKKTVNKGDREELRGIVRGATNKAVKELPFYMNRFNEGVEKMRTAVKSEMDAAATLMIDKLGRRALAERIDDSDPGFLLPPDNTPLTGVHAANRRRRLPVDATPKDGGKS